MNLRSLDLPRQSLLVDAARALAGLSYGDPATRGRYIANLYPYDAPQVADQMASGQESCGLTCEAILRAVGVDGSIDWRRKEQGAHVEMRVDLLRVPYALRWCTPPREGEYGLGAVSYQLELARQHGALWACPGSVEEALDLCEPGAMVQLEGPAHVLTVIGRLADGSLETVEGGQVDGRNGGKCTAALALRRELLLGAGGVRLRSGGSAGVGRRVVSILRAWELPTR